MSTPPGFKAAYRAFVDNGWSIIDARPEHGGQGLPHLLQFLVSEVMASCNLSFKLYTELSAGAYHLLASTASPALQERYLPNLVDGTWSGTMCLTEPHCGTDLGLLSTRAMPNGDGSYAVSGTKIFITSGDHDLTDNILHLVLARLDGAPAGTRGISLFLVPKILVNQDGSLGERNGVTTGSIEHKMGIHGSATCVLHFDGAEAYLVGEENRGLAAMFKMMNLERLVVGTQGLGIAEAARQNALAYARERLQSKAPPPRPDMSKSADPIILQPDIRLKLLRIRSLVEGARALVVYTGLQADLMHKSKDPAEREAAEDWVALLTPVVKAFLSDLGVSAALSAQQVFGGHGYICEHGMEQLVRDARIAPIYEGTNGVQAVDLVTRKLVAHEGRLIRRMLEHFEHVLADGGGGKQQDPDVFGPAAAALARLREATDWIVQQLRSDPAAALGAATDYQRLFALTVIACIWAEIAETAGEREGEFYASKRRMAKLYMSQVLPEADGLFRMVTGGARSLAEFQGAEL